MWITLAIISAVGLGFYDVFKKLSVRGNDVLMVLMLNTIFGVLYMSPFIIGSVMSGDGVFLKSGAAHGAILLKAVIVLGSWLLGYFAIKHLPLTVQGPINASRPVLVLIGAVLIYGEIPAPLQWVGIALGILSLLLISRLGSSSKAKVSGDGRWVVFSIGATVLGAISALYDKYLLRYYSPLDVQAWYSLYQCIIMVVVLSLLRSCNRHLAEGFQWRWTIPCIALFLTAADMAYFYALSLPGSMVVIVSMIRRGSVIVSFIYGVIALRERNIGPKLIDLCLLLASLLLIIIGAR